MKKANPKPLTPKLRAELKALADMPDSEIDTTEMPPITDYRLAVRGAEARPRRNCPDSSTPKETAKPQLR
jgi:hypothetical protein